MLKDCVRAGNCKTFCPDPAQLTGTPHCPNGMLQDLTITHHGAIDGVTGSCHRLTLPGGDAVLVDCGLSEGAGQIHPLPWATTRPRAAANV
jgi:hypothetical protein